MRSATAASISHNDIFSNGSTGLTTTGLVFAAAGKSQSFETPTSRSPRPRAKTISVAEGKNEMRRSSVISKEFDKILEFASYNIYINSLLYLGILIRVAKFPPRRRTTKQCAEDYGLLLGCSSGNLWRAA